MTTETRTTQDRQGMHDDAREEAREAQGTAQSGQMYTQAQVDAMRADLYNRQQVEQIFASALKRGMALLQSTSPTAALAAACVAFGRDVSFIGLSGSSMGRVRAEAGRLAVTPLREDAWRSETLQISASTAVTDVSAVLSCIDSDLPATIEEALVGAGVEPGVLTSMYFHETYGPTYRERIAHKAKLICAHITAGLVRNPTGYFIDAIRGNWHLSTDYTPGKRKAAPAKPDPVQQALAEREAKRARQAVGDDLASPLETLVELSSEERWEQSEPTLRLFLSRLLSAAQWSVLEARARAGELCAASVARQATRAKAAGTLPLLVAALQC